MASFLGSLCLVACTDELKSDGTTKPDNGESDLSGSHKVSGFMAFKIKIDTDSKTREDDPYYKDYPQFNKGLEYERALYFPPVKNEQDSGEESLQDAAEGDKGEKDIVAPEIEQIHHFALLVGNDNKVSPVIYPLLQLTGPDENNEDYTLYTYFYNSVDTETENQFEGFQGNTVFIVLNASVSLVNAVKAEIEKTNGITLSDLCNVTFSSTDGSNDFLFLKNKDNKLITYDDVHPYMTMTSSMIIKKGVQTILPAQDGNFETYPSPELAKENATTIYVDRLQAKYTVLFKKRNEGFVYLQYEADIADSAIGNGDGSEDKPIPVSHLLMQPESKIKYIGSYTRSPSINERKEIIPNESEWQINIVGWSINGLEKSEYLFKNLDYSSPYVEQNWFARSGYPYRNFWAEDKNYNQDSGPYPDQFRKVLDVTSTGETTVSSVKSYDGLTPRPALSYFSYDELSKRDVRLYVPENTFNLNVLGDNPYKSKSYKRIGSHLIVTAQLLLKDLEPGGVWNSDRFTTDGLKTDLSNRESVSKFLMNGIFWSEQAYKEYVGEYLAYFMLSADNKNVFGENDGYFYANTQGTRVSSNDFDIVPAEIEGGDGYVWVKPNKIIYKRHGNEFTQISDRLYKYLAYQHPELMAAHYLNGRMYYSEGSYHNTEGDFYNEKTTEVKLGDFGTVRNNWYSFKVLNIASPGTPVSDATQKIIPNNEPVVNAMGVSMELLEWHYISASVDIDHQKPKK